MNDDMMGLSDEEIAALLAELERTSKDIQNIVLAAAHAIVIAFREAILPYFESAEWEQFRDNILRLAEEIQVDDPVSEARQRSREDVRQKRKGLHRKNHEHRYGG